jgi:hypothetical protein
VSSTRGLALGRGDGDSWSGRHCCRQVGDVGVGRCRDRSSSVETSRLKVWIFSLSLSVDFRPPSAGISAE